MKLPKPFEGWEAAIRCQGKLLDEYQVTIAPATSTEPVTVRCFIEAKPDEEFQMVTCPPADGPPYQHDVSMSYCVDGVTIDDSYRRQGELRRSEKRHIYTTTPEGIQRARLKFVPITLTDQEAISTNVAELGNLSIRIEAGTAGRRYEGQRRTAHLSVEDVPEKSKKSLVDQRVAAGTAKPASSRVPMVQWTSKDEIAHAVLVIFTYRTKPTLQAMGLMPRDEQPDDEPATPDRLHPGAGASSELQDEELQAGQIVKEEPLLEGPAAKKRILALEAEVNELRKRVKRPGESSSHRKLGLCIASAIDLTEG